MYARSKGAGILLGRRRFVKGGRVNALPRSGRQRPCAGDLSLAATPGTPSPPRTEKRCAVSTDAEFLSLYIHIERVGNTSAASIPLALHDAVRDGVIDRPLRVFAPGFGAGAVGGYVVMRVAPAIAA